MSAPEKDPQQLIKQIGRALLGAAPPNWKRIRAEYRSAGRHVEADVLVTADDEQQYPIRPPMDVVELLGELRALMYRPGRGTWMSGLYVLDHPSKYNAEFEPDAEPRWRRVPPPIGFQDELRRFPREDAHIPEWLRARAGLPPLAEPTPASGIPQPEGTPSPAEPSPGGTPAPPSGSGPRPHPGHTPPGGLPLPPDGGPAPTSGPGYTPQGGMPPARRAGHTSLTGIPIPAGEDPAGPRGRSQQPFEGGPAGHTPPGRTPIPAPDTSPTGTPASGPPPGGSPWQPHSRPAEHTPPAGIPMHPGEGPPASPFAGHTPPAGTPDTPPHGIPTAPSEGPAANPQSGRYPQPSEGQPAGQAGTPDSPPGEPPRRIRSTPPGGVPFPQQGAALTHTPPTGVPIPAWGMPDDGAAPPTSMPRDNPDAAGGHAV